jgi:hypothetical protein
MSIPLIDEKKVTTEYLRRSFVLSGIDASAQVEKQPIKKSLATRRFNFMAAFSIWSNYTKM